MNVYIFKAFTASLTISLYITLTFFISSFSWADENAHIRKNISFDNKLAHADSIRSSHPKDFLLLINELNQHADQITKSQQYTLDYLNLYLLMYQGKLKEAIDSANTLINSDAANPLKFRAQIGLLNVFAANQNWTEGLATLSSLLTKLPLIHDKKLYLQALMISAIFYNQLGQYDLSMSYAKQLELKSKNGRDQCIAKAQIIESSFKLRELTPTSPIIKQAISLCRINKEDLIISFINSYVAEMYLEKQQQNKALDLLNSTLQDTLNTSYPRIIAITYSLLAQAHWLNKAPLLTKQFALKALESGIETEAIPANILSYKLLFEVEKTQKNYELALLYHEKYAIADKLYYNETQKKYLAFQLAQHQAREQQNKIDLLHKENALLSSEKAMTQSNINNNRLIIVVLLLTLSVLIFWGYRLLKAHKRIKELAEYDSLTGIFNRGHFTNIADTTLEYCKNADQNVSLIMFDLDQFKNVNDNFGHACGDWILQKTAEVCKNLGRQNDILARIGGEEFCILLSSCNIQAAIQRAEACRKAIAEINTAESGFDFTITASFGVTDAKTSGYELEKLLADADSAAYDSKHAGRNEVTIFKHKTNEKKMVKLDDTLNAF